MRLLNSRASGSPKGYADAATEVAAAAAEGKTLQRFVLAVVSREHDAPDAARLDDATREEYLKSSRDKIEKLAHRTKSLPIARTTLSPGICFQSTEEIQTFSSGRHLEETSRHSMHGERCLSIRL